MEVTMNAAAFKGKGKEDDVEEAMSEEVKNMYHNIYKAMSPEEKEKECELLFKDLDREQIPRINYKLEKIYEKIAQVKKKWFQEMVKNEEIYESSIMDVRLPLSSSSTLIIQGGNITKWFINGSTDAIVCPTNETLLGIGGTTANGGPIQRLYAGGDIHRVAGPNLAKACREVPEVRPGVRCPTGEARITPGFLLPVSHVIHTVGPIFDVDSNFVPSLASAYRDSLRVAKENNIEYIAFPATTCGVRGYPYDEAATVAISAIREFQNDFKEVHFIYFKPRVYHFWLMKGYEMLNVSVPLEVERMIEILQNKGPVFSPMTSEIQ